MDDSVPCRGIPKNEKSSENSVANEIDRVGSGKIPAILRSEGKASENGRHAHSYFWPPTADFYPSKMKVTPGIFMKTKERERREKEVRRLETGGEERTPRFAVDVRRGETVQHIHYDSWIPAPCFFHQK